MEGLDLRKARFFSGRDMDDGSMIGVECLVFGIFIVAASACTGSVGASYWPGSGMNAAKQWDLSDHAVNPLCSWSFPIWPYM